MCASECRPLTVNISSCSAGRADTDVRGNAQENVAVDRAQLEVRNDHDLAARRRSRCEPRHSTVNAFRDIVRDDTAPPERTRAFLACEAGRRVARFIQAPWVAARAEADAANRARETPNSRVRDLVELVLILEHETIAELCMRSRCNVSSTRNAPGARRCTRAAARLGEAVYSACGRVWAGPDNGGGAHASTRLGEVCGFNRARRRVAPSPTRVR
jgi:hypothetical protein